MSERKLKCAKCGKWFKTHDYKHLLCPACEAATRSAKTAGVSAPSALTARGQNTNSVLPRRMAATAPSAGALPHGMPTTESATLVATMPAPPATPSEPQMMPEQDASLPAISRPKVHGVRELTAEERAAVERRYLELAQPREFDGIRGQIAAELALPKALVKHIVHDLRTRLGMQSWWDFQQPGTISEAVMAAVRERYLPLLPMPPIGIHDQLAKNLGLTPLEVYRAIARIRHDLGLPRFNQRPDAPSLERPTQPTAAPG